MQTSNEKAPISVIIPCYQCRDTLPRAVDSILNQTLLPEEVILVDDASSDGTQEVILELAKKHPGFVTPIVLKTNGGPGIARNEAWQIAKQPWLAFLDADDVWHLRKIEIQWGWMKKNPQVVLTGHSSSVFSETNKTEVNECPSFKRVTLWNMLLSCRIQTRSAIIKKDVSFRFGTSKRSEDYFLWLLVVGSGAPTFRTEERLAFTFREEFSSGGLSGQLWEHEKAEIKTLRNFQKAHGLFFVFSWIAIVWSLIKFFRRWMVRGGTQ